jgi:hypothetical protein
VSASSGFAVLRVLDTWFAPAESLQGDAASIGYILGKGWVLFGIDQEPVATFVTEEDAKAELEKYIASHDVKVEA